MSATKETKPELEPIVPMDDAELDSMPTRVIHPEERAQLSAAKPASAPPPPVATALSEHKLPPPPRPAHFRSRLPTEPSSHRLSQAQAPSSAALGSVPPIALSEPPPPIELPIRRVPRGLMAAASVAAVALLGVGLLGAKGAIFASHGTGSLVTTVAGAEGGPVKGLSVFVDGTKRCESSPCRVDELDVGSHFVKVTAPGYVPTAAQAVAVQSGQDAVMRLALAAVQPEKKSDDAKVAENDAKSDSPADNTKSDDEGAVQASALPAAPDKAPARRAVYHHHWAPAHHAAAAPVAHHEAAAKPAPAAPSGKGILVLSSTPATNVVVDGHPLGSTPKAVRVDAGVHTVVFAGEAGRAVRAIKVNPDDRLNVAVRF